ncbi:MAG: protein kinase [Deltaproteobacteria bacterium]|jgi:serine/threonine-protein kinase|nr:protein kinase [Deltaproteobacteria bacterium]
MSIKVSFTVTKGPEAGKSFSYDSNESLILGREEDCGIVFHDPGVSRYHCLIDIAPPSVVVRDFGSLNGTFLNGQKIGQRNKDDKPTEAQKNRGTVFPLNSGDRLGLGQETEIRLEVKLPQYCADCFAEIENSENVNPEGLPICADCHEKRVKQEQTSAAEPKGGGKPKGKAGKKSPRRPAKPKAPKDGEVTPAPDGDQARQAAEEAARQEAEDKARQAAEEAARQAAEEAARKEAEEAARKAQAEKLGAKRHCEICGKTMSGDDSIDICDECRDNPLKVLMYMLEKARRGAEAGDIQAIAGYRNVKMLGQGGMGQVWLVEEEETGQLMALKLMLPQRAEDESSRENFLREAFLGWQLNHKNIVRYQKCGQSNGAYFILMEYCEGGSVDKLIAENGGRLSVDKATNIILQALEGLEFAHQAEVVAKSEQGVNIKVKGVVHRDFKPGNLFLDGTGKNAVVKVADFGLAKAYELSGLSGHTRTGQTAGSPVFMPRQQIINYKYSKPDVDVWAAAASYYHMLTGEYPKKFVPGKDILSAALTGDAVPIRQRGVDIPAKLAKVIDQALVEKPKIGVQSASELRRMILDVI